MKSIILFSGRVLCGVWLIQAGVVAAAPPAVAPRLFESAPIIDGALTDAVWLTTCEAGPFWNIQEPDQPVAQTTLFKIGYDASNLYVAVICEGGKSVANLPAGASLKDDDGIFKGESIEMFVDPEQKKQTYYQIVISARGSLWDAANTGEGGNIKTLDKSWNSDGQIGVQSISNGWQMECAFPWKSFQAEPASGKKWGFGVNRNMHLMRDGNSACLYLMWSPSSRGFHDLANFGTLWFGGEAEIVKANQAELETLRREISPLKEKIDRVLQPAIPRHDEFCRRRAELFDPIFADDSATSPYLKSGRIKAAVNRAHAQWKDLYYDILFAALLGE